MSKPMIVILGPTATGKTRIAALLADRIGGEIISADSRQIYRGMDIGTGKDLEDYFVNGNRVEAHLVDIAEAGEKYSIFKYKQDFEIALEDVIRRNNYPIVCGGSGMYLETALGLYSMKEVPENIIFRNQVTELTDEQLIIWLKAMKPVHNTTDLTDRSRLIRALEIAIFENEQGDKLVMHNDKKSLSTASFHKSDESEISIPSGYDKPPRTKFIYGVETPREVVRARITDRLRKRLDEGLIEEVQHLMGKGIPADTLYYYGLEYKYVTMYLEGLLSFDRMFSELNTAIHQFAKRQMTWFRRMERRGIPVKWLKNEPEYIVNTIIKDIKAIK